jgi:pyruvate/2-oxoglutarate dehydrogenase complex dihydrolipoamide dehydrogenase (E3) component
LKVFDVIVIGAGPAGVFAALRAADLGARTALITRDEFGGMAANDGPVPVRTLAQAARLMRDARQLGMFGIDVSEPVLDYSRLLERVRTVVHDVRMHSALRAQIDSLHVVVYERAGASKFIDSHTVQAENGLRLLAQKIIICSGGVNRRLSVPGFDLTATPRDAWSLASLPPSMLVVGGGSTGAQVASIFNAFGTRVELFEAGPRILATEDEDVSAGVAAAFRASGITVRESFGKIESFKKTPGGVRMSFSKDGVLAGAEAAVVVAAVGWAADTATLNLWKAGIEIDQRGFVRVDNYLRTSAPHIFAAGDVTGRMMLVPQATHDGFVAASNAVRGAKMTADHPVNPVGSFTDPEYAHVGLSEKRARQGHNVVTAVVHFHSTTRTIIDGRTTGFCKLIVDRATSRILGCHVVGERAVDITQVAAIAIAAGMRVDQLAQVPVSFPSYSAILGRVAASATRQLNMRPSWLGNQAEEAA